MRPTLFLGGSGGGGGAGKVSMHDFQFVMKLNKASPSLMRACATGQHIKTATLTGRKAGKGQQEYLTLVLRRPRQLVSDSWIRGGRSLPIDEVSFNFAEVEVEYKPQKPDGSLAPGVPFKYDLKTNKAY